MIAADGEMVSSICEIMAIANFPAKYGSDPWIRKRKTKYVVKIAFIR